MYIIDTSSLIRLSRDYPRDLFESVWSAVESLISAGRLVAPREVLREISKGDDELSKWAKRHAELFVDLDPDQATILVEIDERFPGIVDAGRLGPNADPIVVALGIKLIRGSNPTECIVVTEERIGGPGSARIPNVCLEFSLGVVNLLDFFRKEGFAF